MEIMAVFTISGLYLSNYCRESLESYHSAGIEEDQSPSSRANRSDSSHQLLPRFVVTTNKYRIFRCYQLKLASGTY